MLFRMECRSSSGEVTFEQREKERGGWGYLQDDHAKPGVYDLGKAERQGAPIHLPLHSR